jgi:hypothetical protein
MLASYSCGSVDFFNNTQANVRVFSATQPGASVMGEIHTKAGGDNSLDTK